LRIIEEGELGAGDGIRVIERPQHDVTVRDVFRIYTKDRDEAERLLAVPGLSGAWRGWAEDTLARRRAR
jgi:MOSC domain-containing protein YiiM